MTKYYQVAGHVFSITAPPTDLLLMDNYAPFVVDDATANSVVFQLVVDDGEPVIYQEEIRQDDGEQMIVCGSNDRHQPVFEFVFQQQKAGWMVCNADYKVGNLTVTAQHRKWAIDNALMVLFALATAKLGTALFHAAVVSHEGRGYLFLGKSGTGKSTHARLWMQIIERTELLNDDNPVVRVIGDEAMVYGSPWSGKTPCYRNVSVPLGGIVKLSQAPYNNIRRLNGVEAYAVLVSSISGKRWDAQLAEGLHQTQDALATIVPTWHLECLPNEEAARLCKETLYCIHDND